MFDDAVTRFFNNACPDHHVRGCGYGCGTVYRLDPATGVITTLANFSGGSDGALPGGALLLYGGFLYGTTKNGGFSPAPGYSGYGTIFKLNPKTTAEEWFAKSKAAGNIAPQAKLANEKPKGETIDYDTLIKSWPASPPKK